MKMVECPSCGCRFAIKSGRSKKDIDVHKVIGQLKQDLSVRKTSKSLNCSKMTIYKILKYAGIDPKSITGRKYTKRSNQIENGN